MKTIKIGEKEYTLEFTFEAAEHKSLVQAMFNVMSGAYILKNGADASTENEAAAAMINGVSEMVADVPHICRTAFYAGLLENNPVSEDEARALMRQYMKENKLSYNAVFEDMKKCMEEDGFFDLSGLTEMLQKMSEAAAEKVKAAEKSTSTK